MPRKLIGTMAALALGLNSCVSPPAIPTPKKTEALQPPIRIFVAIDDSMSVGESKIPRMSIENLRPLTELIEKWGGELRLAEVCTNSDLRMNSFYVAEPLVAPQPPAPLGTVNPLDLPRLQKLHRAEEKIYQQKLASYNQSMMIRQQKAQGDSAELMAKVSKILEKSPSCQASDIKGLIKRGDLYMSETGNWHQTPRNVALLVTDGLETVQKQPEKVEFSSKPQVLLVSSGGQAGILQPLLGSEKPYESIEGAVRFITGQ